MQEQRPDRVELFAFYYLGVNPDGEYRFANAHHVAKYYGVSADAVLRWLEELDLKPRDVLRQQFNLSGPQLELQLELPNLDPAGVRQRAAAILADLDGADGGRRFWEGD
ncbi:MAG TPA: hypothetical protein PKD58_12500 [Candidatus Sumerlaeota bacterium]|nr:hypothetical protein [Candidatus Sumerlaeota bacterium]HMX63879.1 hypothetical protein [Candidatus Sumerlaeota bacterium]HMZ51020.1 hypothetical protein [Candidatus Sumerlaeota bacterium]